MTLALSRTTSDDPDFRALIAVLDDDLRERYGPVQDLYAVHNLFSCDTVIVARQGGVAVGCGCFKRYDDDSVELKRMIVAPAHRGAQIGRTLVRALEAWAVELGYRAAVLETGDRQHEALRMYRACGYHDIPLYGPYVDLPNSVCLRRTLTA